MAKKKPEENRRVRDVVLTSEELRAMRGHLISARRICERKGVKWSDVIAAFTDEKAKAIVKSRTCGRRPKAKNQG